MHVIQPENLNNQELYLQSFGFDGPQDYLFDF